MEEHVGQVAPENEDIGIKWKNCEILTWFAILWDASVWIWGRQSWKLPQQCWVYLEEVLPGIPPHLLLRSPRCSGAAWRGRQIPLKIIVEVESSWKDDWLIFEEVPVLCRHPPPCWCTWKGSRHPQQSQVVHLAPPLWRSEGVKVDLWKFSGSQLHLEIWYMRRQGMSAALTRSRRRPFLGSCRWIWVLPPVALALLVLLAAGVDGQLLQLLLQGQPPDHLLPLLEPLQVVVQSQVPPVVLFVTASKSCHLTDSQCEELAVHLEPASLPSSCLGESRAWRWCESQRGCFWCCPSTAWQSHSPNAYFFLSKSESANPVYISRKQSASWTPSSTLYLACPAWLLQVYTLYSTTNKGAPYPYAARHQHKCTETITNIHLVLERHSSFYKGTNKGRQM